MNRPNPLEHPLPLQTQSPAQRLRIETGLLAGRLAELLRNRFAEPPASIAPSIAFLEQAFQRAEAEREAGPYSGDTLYPLDILTARFALSSLETDLLLLAGMAEEHEGYAEIFRSLHPCHKPFPTLGLAAQLYCQDTHERHLLREVLETGPVVQAGIVRLEEDGPYFDRNLSLAEKLWPVLHGIDACPTTLQHLQEIAASHGLEEWLLQEEVVRAQKALQSRWECSVLISAEDEMVAFNRALALCTEVGIKPFGVAVSAQIDANQEQLIQLHATARSAVPVLRLNRSEGPERIKAPGFLSFPGPVIFCAGHGVSGLETPRPLIHLLVERMSSRALREMWNKILPPLRDQAATLAARYPVEPVRARQVATDLKLLKKTQEVDHLCLHHVATSIRARSATSVRGGIQLIRPQAGWEHLILPDRQMAQLREAVNRLYLQAQVLDQWGFLQGRRGARGVRMLFAGPPGTGKTLSAEVLAHTLEVDLLQVDLSRVVSKWIGETEKNLAEVFETAESSKSVLLFDEADALFGKRTEVSDAHDRYANLETAYLLSRLERYEGLAILSTNLRQNIDAAFTRRLEYIVEFEEPGRDQRLALWRCHLPKGVPLADNVRLEELAAHFNIVGGLIRNAAVSAAFLAAAEGTSIDRKHFIHAIRREYEKAGKAWRDLAIE